VKTSDMFGMPPRACAIERHGGAVEGAQLRPAGDPAQSEGFFSTQRSAAPSGVGVARPRPRLARLHLGSGARQKNARIAPRLEAAKPRPANPSSSIAQVEGSGTGLPVVNSMVKEPFDCPTPARSSPTARTSPPMKQAEP
jgi:hypothetical protein